MKKKKTLNNKFKGKKVANVGEHIDCKFSGRGRVLNRMKYPAYGQRCSRCEKKTIILH